MKKHLGHRDVRRARQSRRLDFERLESRRVLASVLSFLQDGINWLEDDDFESLVIDGNNNGVIDVGDRFVGVFRVQSINGTGVGAAGMPTVTAVFAFELFSKVATGTNMVMGFGPLQGGGVNDAIAQWASLNTTLSALGLGDLPTIFSNNTMTVLYDFPDWALGNQAATNPIDTFDDDAGGVPIAEFGFTSPYNTTTQRTSLDEMWQTVGRYNYDPLGGPVEDLDIDEPADIARLLQTGQTPQNLLSLNVTHEYAAPLSFLTTDQVFPALQPADLQATGVFISSALQPPGKFGLTTDTDLVVNILFDQPAIELVKLTNDTDNDTPTGPIVPVGSTVTWTYNVTNPGNEPIANVVVTDDNGTPLNLGDDFNPAPTLAGGFNIGDLNTDNLLDPGELWVYTASALAVAGQYENYATVTGTSTISNTPVTDDNPDHYFAAEPEIQIIKLTNGTDNDDPTGPIVPVGSTVTWTYNVTNPGNEPIANVVVTDDNGTPLNLGDDFNPAPTLVGGFNIGDLNTDNLLDPGELWVYTASALAVAGQYENYATVTGTSTISNTPVTDDNPDHYFGEVPFFVLGPDKNPGFPQLVKVVDITGNWWGFPAYGNSYVGGTRVAVADLDSNGTDEIITAPGFNHGPLVRVFTLTGGEVSGFPSFLAYDEDYLGGVQLTVADVNGDQRPDIITVPSYGAAEVRVFINQYPSTPAFEPTPDISFLAYPEVTMFGAVVTAADMGSFDINGQFVNVLDGRAEIVVGTNGGIQTKVSVWEVTGATPEPVAEFTPFDALNPNFLGGVSLDVAWIDQNADPTQDPPDILAGMGVNGTSQIEVWAWNTSDATLSMRGEISSAFPPPSDNAPVRVAGLDTNGDKIADSILAVQGPIGTTGEVRRFDITSSSPALVVSPPVVLSGFPGPWFIATGKPAHSLPDVNEVEHREYLFDFNSNNKYTATDYTGVLASDVYTAARGYGWASKASAFDRTSPDVVRRDGHSGKSNTFRAAVDMSQASYFVSISLGDRTKATDNVQIRLEGVPQITVSTVKGQFVTQSFTIQTSAISPDGILDIEFVDLDTKRTKRYFAVNTVEIATPQQLTKFVSEASGGPQATGLSVDHREYRFDLNSNNKYTATDYTGVLKSHVYTAARGYGWASKASAFDRRSPDNVHRDGHSGKSNTFRVAVDMSQPSYVVTVSLGDRTKATDNVQISLEGVPQTTVSTGKGQFLTQSFTIQTSAISSDGILDIGFVDLDTKSRKRYFAVNAVDIATPQRLTGFDPNASGGSQAAALTQRDLAPILQAATDRWLATGLTPELAARLQSVTTTIEDLRGPGYLALNDGLVLRIDDDAAGRGWFIDPSPADDAEFCGGAGSGDRLAARRGSEAFDRIDLLTVVMHELGHVLGRPDLDAPDSADDLMHGELPAGTRRTLDATVWADAADAVWREGV